MKSITNRDELKNATVKYFNTDRGFGFFLTADNAELWFHVRDGRSCRLDDKNVDKVIWHTHIAVEPKEGDPVLYVEGTDTHNRPKVIRWGHVGDLNPGQRSEKTGVPRDILNSGQGRGMYMTLTGTLVRPTAGQDKIFEAKTDSVEFECAPDEYRQEVIQFEAPVHPDQQKRLYEGTPTYRYVNLYGGFPELAEGEVLLAFGSGYFTDGRTPARTLEFWARSSLGSGITCIERSHVIFHLDGSARLDTPAGDREHRGGRRYGVGDKPHTEALLAEVGIALVWEERPTNAENAKTHNWKQFCARHRPSPEREAEILNEVRDRFRWNIYPEATPLAGTVILPVAHVYSAIAPDFGKSSHISVALIGVYDPECLSEWESTKINGLRLSLHGSAGWGPGTSVFSMEPGRLPIPDQRGEFERIADSRGFVDNSRWELLAYAETEDGLAEFRQKFEELDRRSGTGAIMLIGAEGQLGNSNVMG